MRILSYNCGHDGATALIEDGRLVHYLESEKDNGLRHMWSVTPTLFLRSMQLDDVPDVVAVSGFHRPGLRGEVVTRLARDSVEGGYFDEGTGGKISTHTLFAGKRIRRFSSSHVRSHIMCSYGLSPFAQGQPCYALIWEGHIGSMYYIDEHVVIHKLADVLRGPGARYAFMYWLADPAVPNISEAPGKVMALAAYGRRGKITSVEQETIDFILSFDIFGTEWSKAKFGDNDYFDIGVESQEFKDLAWQFQSALFNRFYNFAKERVTQKLPLLIGGGCGLNCDWNSQWKECGLFSDVFVPPCTNDSGVALGAAIDALHHYTGNAKVSWSVYSGDTFVEDDVGPGGFACKTLDHSEVCRSLLNGDVIAWVQGRYEIGPRALGNRSILAAPFSAETRDKLNRIKQREAFRPVAPICLEEDLGRHFEPDFPSPHMLYFQRVKSRELGAITHVDGSARGQSVSDAENPEICKLLREFRRQSGVGVLCNTSLNFKGSGFINRLSHLLQFAQERGLEGVVVGSRYWTSRHST